MFVSLEDQSRIVNKLHVIQNSFSRPVHTWLHALQHKMRDTERDRGAISEPLLLSPWAHSPLLLNHVVVVNMTCRVDTQNDGKHCHPLSRTLDFCARAQSDRPHSAGTEEDGSLAEG